MFAEYQKRLQGLFFLEMLEFRFQLLRLCYELFVVDSFYFTYIRVYKRITESFVRQDSNRFQRIIPQNVSILKDEIRISISMRFICS